MLLSYASSWVYSWVPGPLGRKSLTTLLLASTILYRLFTIHVHHHYHHVKQDKKLQLIMEDLALDATKKTRPASIDISRIMLQSGQNSPRQPPPAERISSSPTTRTSMESVQTSTSSTSISHSRSTSSVDNSRQNKRLSLSFPIQQPNSRPSS